MSDTDRGVIYEFGSFRVDPVKRQLLRDGEAVHLTAKAFETLLILIKNAGETISKEELIDSVWLDVIVEENNLTQQISALRKALDERPSEHKFIVTIPGRGYTFIAPVKEVDNSEVPLEAVSSKSGTNIPNQFNHLQPFINWVGQRDKGKGRRLAVAFVPIIVLLVASIFWTYHRRTVSTRPPQTIAVLPFRSIDTNDDLLEAGIRDTLTAKLGNLQELNVRPTGPAASYLVQDPLAAGRELHVDAVLNGTIQHDGEQIRVTVQMLDVAGGKIMWGKSFDSRVSAAFAVQDSISAEIVKGVEEYYAAN